LEKIKQIEISNFKSIKHLKIDGCNTINIFVGMPNAGKSNILEAITLSYLVYPDLDDNLTDFIRYDKFTDLFFEGNNNGDFSNFIKIDSCIYSIGLLEKPNLQITHFKDIDNYVDTIYDLDGNQKGQKHKLQNESIIKFRIRGYKFKSNVNKRDSDVYSNSFLSPIFGSNLGEVISSNPELRKYVNQLFSENNLKLLIDKSSYELKIFKEYQDGTVFTLPYNMIADTLQRLIFYKAAIMSNKNTVLLFEEPEAHCFEPYILEFTNAIKYDKNDNQYFIVTHSDYIIQEFLREEESKQKTNIYLVNNVDGETQVKLLDKAKNDDVYEYGMNLFFNFESLWDNN
jgi:AAA15 family ATPase/GTPase